MQDLTKINVPFGLLDKETKERLQAHGGPYEFYMKGDKWENLSHLEPSWHECYVYRVQSRPEQKTPKKPDVKVGSLWRFSDGSFKGYLYELLSLRPDGSVVLMADRNDDIIHSQWGEFEALFEQYAPPRKCEAWVNVYDIDGELKLGIKTYQNEKEAEEATLHYRKRIATVKIQYVECQDND